MADNVLICGSQGFIGGHLARHLHSLGNQVIGLDRVSGASSDWENRVIDLSERQSVLNMVTNIKPRWVFNLTGEINHTLSWPEQRLIMDQHWLSVLNLVEALALHIPEVFINIGSSDEYGSQPAPQHEGMRERPIAPYSAAKVAATHYLQMLHRATNFPSIIARFFLIYGPGQDLNRLIPQASLGLLRGETLAASPGLQKRDFLYIQDAVEGLTALALTPIARGEIFNVASGQPVIVREVLELLQQLIGTGTIDFGARPMREGEVMELYADIGRMQTVTGWQPHINLAQGLSRTIDYYRYNI
jgi:nucleoside-diphosphate-sugar epimerase